MFPNVVCFLLGNDGFVFVMLVVCYDIFKLFFLILIFKRHMRKEEWNSLWLFNYLAVSGIY